MKMNWEHIYISEMTDEEYAYGLSLMSGERRLKVNNFLYDEDRRRTVAGELLARKMISSFTAMPIDEISFAVGKFGKPYVLNSGVQFNISHSDNVAVCCVDTAPVGIDVERIRPINPAVLKRVCKDGDRDYIVSGELCKELSGEQLYRFFEVWTAKEAYLKRIGTGIRDIKTVSFEDIKSGIKFFELDDYLISVSL